MSGHDPCFTPVVEVSDDTLASSHPRLSLHALTAQNQSGISTNNARTHGVLKSQETFRIPLSQ